MAGVSKTKDGPLQNQWNGNAKPADCVREGGLQHFQAWRMALPSMADDVLKGGRRRARGRRVACARVANFVFKGCWRCAQGCRAVLWNPLARISYAAAGQALCCRPNLRSI